LRRCAYCHQQTGHKMSCPKLKVVVHMEMIQDELLSEVIKKIKKDNETNR
jgi:sulfatase maturation enzyme AslB (radical SAM superfamily)